MISNVSGRHNRHNNLCASGSVGGARPCQGRGRGFESRLALSFNKKDIRWMSFFVKSSPAGPGRSRSTLRSGRRRADVHWTSCAVSRSAVESLGNFWLINHWSKKFSLIQTRQIQRWIQTYLFRFSAILLHILFWPADFLLPICCHFIITGTKIFYNLYSNFLQNFILYKSHFLRTIHSIML